MILSKEEKLRAKKALESKDNEELDAPSLAKRKWRGSVCEFCGSIYDKYYGCQNCGGGELHDGD